MDPRDLRTLQLLKEIEKNHMPSQRQLARQLNISLGLVNSFVKRLAQKGYFKITHIPKNRVRYILTPKGAAEKTRLTYAYIKYSYTFYKDARHKLRELFRHLERQGARRLVFYGTGDLAEIAYLSLQETSMELVAVIDDQKVGNKFMGRVINDIGNIKEIQFDRILITAVESVQDVQQVLIEKGISNGKITVLH